MVARSFIQLAVGFALASTLLLPAPAAAVELEHQDMLETNPALSLKQTLELTFKRNPQQYQLQARDRDVLARQSRSASLLPKPPALALSHQNDGLGSGRGEREWQADVEIPLWRLGQRAARTAVAENAQLGVQASRWSVMSSAGIRPVSWPKPISCWRSRNHCKRGPRPCVPMPN
jgi:hypothetical protein